MTKPEYQYDETASAAKNIAAGLFAIANEMSRLIDNNFEQAKKNLEARREDLQEISKTLKYIFESVKVLYPKNENSELPSETYFDCNAPDLSPAIDNLTKELTHIKKILKKHFSTDEDEDEYGYDYDSND